MQRRLLLFDLGALLLVCVVGSLVHAESIEHALQGGVAHLVEAEGFDRVSVIADGRHLWLGGWVSSPTERHALARIAAAVAGVRKVDTDLFLAVPSSQTQTVPHHRSSHLEIRIFGEAVYVAGLVADAQSRDRLMAGAWAAAGERFVSEEIEVQGDVAPAPWLASVAGILGLLEEAVEDPLLRIEGDRVLLRGTVPDEELRAQLESLVQSALPRLTLLSELRVAPVRSLTTFQLQALLDSYTGGRGIEFLPGTAHLQGYSLAVLDRIAEALARTSPGMMVEIAGHIASTGHEPRDAELSWNRVRIVADELARRGVDRDRLIPTAYGASRPVVQHLAGQDREVNERVEFWVSSEVRPTEEDLLGPNRHRQQGAGGDPQRPQSLAVTRWSKIDRADSAELVITGTLDNQSAEGAGDIGLTVLLYDARRSLVESRAATLSATTLEPGEKCKFRAVFSGHLPYSEIAFDIESSALR